ncbi:TRAP transporter small permease [Roseibium aggregatum]|uniref:TRAP transporter small permease protein n=1 Tax=Roseibium aggregatum TaxID=187304 RepID=A0A939EIK9_9HYPH|nr:TRAP transporter small permease [Roseibium aggregatum]MBN9672279.1 TRAP transporter small permease [Roseibium aggregatum]
MTAQTALPKPLTGLRVLVARILPAVAAGLILAMVAVTVVDVIGRYIFNAPLSGAFELTQVLLAGLVMTGLPITTLKGGHVEVDILSGMWSPTTKRIVSAFGAGVTSLVLFAVSWTLVRHGTALFGDGATTVELSLPLWPAAALGAFTFAASAFTALLPSQLVRRF